MLQAVLAFTRKFSNYCSVWCVCLVFISLKGSYVSTTNIECIPLSQCPFAMKLIKTKTYHPETIKFLSSSHCGYTNKRPNIWCPLFDAKNCTTPDSKKGICKPLNECNSFLNYKKNVNVDDPLVQKYLRAYQCEFDSNSEERVCCPEEEKKFDITTEVQERFLITFPNTNSEEVCGKQSLDNKIVGGKEAFLGEYPWLALLKYVNKTQVKHACGGSLINQNYVITAAHCVDPNIIKKKYLGQLQNIILGEHDLRNQTDCIYQKYGEDCADPIQEFGVSNYIMHPKYDRILMINDIAIIRLDREAIYSDYVQPICLPPANFKLQGNERFSISGWGQTERVRHSPVKRKTIVNYTNSTICNQIKTNRKLPEQQICAGIGKGTDSCYGDSGGPLMLNIKTNQDIATFAIGVVSYGYGKICGSFPGVYTYMPSYINWIKNQMR